MGIRTIYINPKDWAEADDNAHAEYFSVAKDRGVTIEFYRGGDAEPDLLITLSDDNPPAREPSVYDGESACGRQPWEHRLRQLLKLDDPCFRRK